ncbi:hypothetical protein C5167_036208 [Papaver somniferum]|nr:hypothetical protein C5167_036208 [Papaver somniferum]
MSVCPECRGSGEVINEKDMVGEVINEKDRDVNSAKGTKLPRKRRR